MANRQHQDQVGLIDTVDQDVLTQHEASISFGICRPPRRAGPGKSGESLHGAEESTHDRPSRGLPRRSTMLLRQRTAYFVQRTCTSVFQLIENCRLHLFVIHQVSSGDVHEALLDIA